MSRFKVTFNVSLAQQAEKAAAVAAKVVFSEMNGRFQEAIGSKVWQWPRETTRSNGRSVGSPRTIVDTGALRQSNVFAVSNYSAVFRWTVDYASFVHEGAMVYPYGDTQRQRVYTPPRPWTAAVLGTEKVSGLEPYDYRQRFKDVWLKAIKI
jgi:hypothetical protein